jgi:predicted DNA-binding transcriptional regulator YafY
VNRTDRLYAIVEELRAAAPGSRTARELADLYEISTRTIERDVLALQEAGVPIRGAAGRRGGYSIDPARTLPPVNFTPAEALAITVALAADTGPFAAAGRAARNKVLAAMSADDLEATKAMAERVRRYRRPRAGGATPQVPLTVQRAIAEQLVVAIDYLDRDSVPSKREVEPMGVVALDDDWYLVGWCRLREDARRFRLDRIYGAELTGDPAPVRDPERFLEFMPWLQSPSDLLG